MTLEEAETLALSILKQVMEEKLNSTNVEIASISIKRPVFHIYTKEELDVIIARLPAQQQ